MKKIGYLVFNSIESRLPKIIELEVIDDDPTRAYYQVCTNGKISGSIKKTSFDATYSLTKEEAFDDYIESLNKKSEKLKKELLENQDLIDFSLTYKEQIIQSPKT